MMEGPGRGALDELYRRLRSLERMRDAFAGGSGGLVDPEEDEGSDDERPSMFALVATPSTDDDRAATWTPARPLLDRVETRLRGARRSAYRAARMALADAPTEILESVVDWAVDATAARDLVCECAGEARIWWGCREKTLVRCAWCGLARVASCSIATVAVARPAAFLASPHFHVDGPRAVRHRLSRWHNFRTAVLDEWLEIGAASYRVSVERLFTTTLSVGCVGRRSPGVNRTTDWIPGYEAETAALVASSQAGADLASTAIGARAPEPARLGDGSRVFVERGTVIDVHLDRDKEALSFDIDGIPVHTPILAPKAQPLVLAVGLIYAQDTVHVARTSPS
ncbi:hypothetical protein CTAYLR_010106 [Chrysophaeum taylorii]|uniref:Uncharacterized protein n=1 Tax=Chrysophaeum taylorii TaxID=2483200 RepID=A0AAD7U772_9STRA|nr:hypothetical protein CTAYLR_010106 [Chrysophaeum taylorii]